MGEVFLAEDTRLRRRVALKVLPENIAADADRLLRFEREAFAASALNHPNILTIFEFGAVGNTHFLVSEFVDGVSLRQRLNGDTVTLSETLEIALQIASALQAAHEAGIIHRDIKPDNLMLRADGYVKVLDFGLAKLSEPGAVATGSVSDPEAQTRKHLQTQAGIIMGTVAYMSPEQARGLAVDKRTDIWSLGCVLYEMLSRQQPFDGETITDTLANIIHREPVSIVSLRRDVNAELERIINRTLSKNRDERYQTANELLADLKQLQKRLEFEAELERSSAPNLDTEARTQVIRSATTQESGTGNSIAVLPFSNLSADPDNEYFCDGLAEELLNALAKIDHLKVAARTSAFSFKGKSTNVSEIGRKLSVKTVLEGSVRRSGSRLRITVQLVNAADGYHLWSERYDRELQDIFDVQDEITLAIIDVLKVKLFGDEKAALLKRYTDNTEAYQLYLQGRYCYNKYTPDYFQKGIEYFEQAIELEPEYAPAYAGLGFCYGSLFYFGSVAPHQIVPKWRALIDKSLEIDDRLGDAYLSRASIEFYYNWDFAQAELDYQRAIELNPNSPDAHWRYGHFLANCGRFDEAIEQGERAIALDPLSLVVQFFMSRIYLLAQRVDHGFEQLRKMQAIEPNFAGGLTQLGGLYLVTGKYDEAIEAYEKSRSLGHFVVPVLSYLGAAYGLAGKRDDAYKILDQLFEMKQSQYVSPFGIARVYCGLGENDKAFEWFERAFEERSGEMVALKSEVLSHLMGNTIIRDDRFQDLVRRVGMRVDLPSLNKTTNEADEAPTAMLSPVTVNSSDAPFSKNEEEQSGPDKAKTRRRSLLITLLSLVVLIATFCGYRYFSSNKQIESIAVMPFINSSGNADVEYLADGMTETLISTLSQLPNLSVKARSTVFRYKGRATDPKTIGRELNVQAILNGRVVQRGDRLTLSLELIDAQTENVIWSDKYERNQTDLVSLQNEIARDVSSKLKLKLSGAEQQKLAKSYTTDSEAYRLYLQGRFYLNKRVGNEFDKAEGYFQQAIAKDPNFALGYVGLAEFISERDRPRAKEYIMRALALDNQLSDAHATLGYQLMLDYDFAASERELKRAIELDPNNGRAYQWNGWRMMMMGLYDQALASFDRAIEIEPTRADIRNNRGACLVAAGRIDDGIAEIKKSMELDPTFPWAHSHISFVSRMKGDRAASVEERARAFELLDRADQATRMRESFAKSGWTGYLREIVSQDWGRLGTSQTRRASLLAELGEKEAAMASLNEAATKGDSWLFSIKYDPAFDPLRDDPRFKELLKKFNPPQ